MVYGTELLLVNCLGIFASLLMFSGDMLLYFTKEEYKDANDLRTEIIRQVPDWRLKLGGNIAPFAAFFYVISYLQMSMIVHEQYRLWGLIVSGLFILGIIVATVYHSNYTYLGLLGKLKDKTAVDIVMKNAQLLEKLYRIPYVTGLLLLSFLIIFGKTIYPIWFILLTPTATFFLIFLWRQLPQPFRIVICGGWANLIFVIYFLASILIQV